MSARNQLRAFFLANGGRIVTAGELRVASGNISEWARRVRELRDEEGYAILSHNDRSDLKPGQYILEDAEPLPKSVRSISKETRALVLDRDGFTCQMCGAAAGEPHAADGGRATRLHLGHIIDKSQGGSDESDNLRALCSLCNEGAANATTDRPSWIKLLTGVRRATQEDQLRLLAWLKRKFPLGYPTLPVLRRSHCHVRGISRPSELQTPYCSKVHHGCFTDACQVLCPARHRCA